MARPINRLRLLALGAATALAVAGLVTVGAVPASAAPLTYTVPGDFADLASAVAAANANPGEDTIEITADFTEPSTIPDIAEGLTIRSTPGSRFTVDLQLVTSSGIKAALPAASSLRIEDVAFTNAPGYVFNIGGILDASTLVIDGVAFASNVGPAVYVPNIVNAATLEVVDAEFSDNDLGAIYATSVTDSAIRIDGTSVAGGSQYGVALSTAGASSVTVTDSSFSGYALGGFGGALDGNTQFGLSTSTLSGNGAGLILSADNDADVVIDQAVFADNAGLGLRITAPISSKSIIDVSRSTATGNAAGGIQVQLSGDGEAHFVNVTAADNPGATFSAFGSQIALQSVLTIDFSTFTWLAGSGGPTPTTAFRGAGELVIDNSIFAGGQGGAGAQGDIRIPTGATLTASVNYSLVGTWNPEADSAVTSSGTNLTIDATTPIDPQLGPLAANGGYGATRLPLDGSLVLDAGDPGYAGTPTTDQRDLPRLSGPRVDMGAVETQAAITPGGGGAPPTLARTGGADPLGAVPWGILAIMLLIDGVFLLLVFRWFAARHRGRSEAGRGRA